MRKIFTLILAFVGASASLFAQTSGGPDQYGYTWKNSNDPTGPAFNWIDITNTGTLVTGLDDDNSSGMFPMGFNFKYYWVDVNQVKIGSNGWLSFNNIGNIAHGFPSIPTADNNANIIAPFMADLNLSDTKGNNPGEVYYYSNNVDTFIVSYINVPFWIQATPDFTGSNTFQVIFSKVDNSITFQYQGMNATIPNLTTFNDVIVGIENPTQTIGIQLFQDVIPPSNTAFKFYRPANSTFQVTDVAPQWFANNDNAARIEVKGRPMDMMVNIGNLGNTNVTNSFTVNTTVKRSSGNLIPLYNQTVTVNNLAQGADTTVKFPVDYTPTVPPVAGNFRVETRTNLSSDLNSSNNLLISELVVIDTTNGARQVTLSYDDGSVANQTRLITSFGAGVYFKPPFYPVDLKSVEAMILVANTVPQPTHGFTVKVYADNGPGGAPGTVLFTDTLRANMIVPAAINSVELLNPVTISSGGFYVSFVKTDTAAQTAYIAVDENAPFAHRSFEVQGNSFAAYRSGDAEDIMINATIGNFPAAITGVKKQLVNNFSVSQNYPNPAADQTTVRFNLKETANVEFILTNVIGNKVKSYNLGRVTAGESDFTFSTAQLASGIYFYTMKVNDQVITKKMVVSK
ncbi:MAG: T9SS type A sorting domain-containing protein [Hymenobacteraceae bacterium]|nr:T9SS type A sorting domain-containing protein [Hymenobacteraceae bacterium]MDX5397335.1 T9SS type A sorting domain-containing protein [Hymenobacteraceae bacterium]MDX5442966.1 T9SS type A sorting domain-containing protein [Hymenobacteraceae bacterium]MDX5513414.1 T9SS type A sorting domain-containing protein [Hymenobacteraceae bacterium]